MEKLQTTLRSMIAKKLRNKDYDIDDLVSWCPSPSLIEGANIYNYIAYNCIASKKDCVNRGELIIVEKCINHPDFIIKKDEYDCSFTVGGANLLMVLSSFSRFFVLEIPLLIKLLNKLMDLVDINYVDSEGFSCFDHLLLVEEGNGPIQMRNFSKEEDEIVRLYISRGAKPCIEQEYGHVRNLIIIMELEEKLKEKEEKIKFYEETLELHPDGKLIKGLADDYDKILKKREKK